jgi:nucleotide-binding universal stress UspA family protein
VATPALNRGVSDWLVYRRIVVPIEGDDDSEIGVSLAAELAPERGGSITAVVVIEVPAELPLEAHMLEEEAAAREALEKAHAIAASRGVRLRERIVRARARGEAIVAEAEAVDADLVVIRAIPRGRKRLFGKTADYVLRHAACRVLVSTPRRA